MEKRYIRVTKTVADFGELILAEELKPDFTADQDYYASHYFYNEAQYQHFQEHGSVKGITDVVTDKVIFDFDCKEDIERARKDALELITRLEKLNIDTNKNIELYFSGQKGFAVGFKIDKLISPKEHQYFAINVLGEGLATLDKSIYNASRVMRIPNTKHNDTEYYKVPLTKKQLRLCDMSEIHAHASQPRHSFKKLTQVSIPQTLFEKKVEPKTKQFVSLDIDLSAKPKHWKDYKWALLNAVKLKAGERTHAMMIIASTCRALGYTRPIAQGFLEAFDAKYSSVTDQDLDPDKIEDKLNNVYNDGWNGGQYSVKNFPWLAEYCERIGIRDTEGEDGFLTVGDMAATFHDYASKFETKIVRTGIEELDKKVLFLTSTHNGILGQPGSGKTSLSLQWLRNAATEDAAALFYSLDMAQPLVYGKLVQQEWGMEFSEAMKLYATDRVQREMVDGYIRERYKNVSFNYRTGTTPEKMKDDVKRFEDKIGKKVRLVITDYLECISGPYSDQTANTGYISNQMKDFANDLDVCSAILLQTQKHSVSDISDPLISMKQIKGSSVIEQASTVVLTLWREGYHPETQEQDKFMSFAVVKNRFGGLWRGDFSWNGANGVVNGLSDEAHEELKQLRELKKKRKADDNNNGGWS